MRRLKRLWGQHKNQAASSPYCYFSCDHITSSSTLTTCISAAYSDAMTTFPAKHSISSTTCSTYPQAVQTCTSDCPAETMAHLVRYIDAAFLYLSGCPAEGGCGPPEQPPAPGTCPAAQTSLDLFQAHCTLPVPRHSACPVSAQTVSSISNSSRLFVMAKCRLQSMNLP